MKKRDIIIGLTVAIIIAVLLSQYASAFPDGLERVAEKLGFIEKSVVAPTLSSPLPDYSVPGLKNEKISTAVAGLTGTLLVFGLGLGTAKLISRFRKNDKTPS